VIRRLHVVCLWGVADHFSSGIGSCSISSTSVAAIGAAKLRVPRAARAAGAAAQRDECHNHQTNNDIDCNSTSGEFAAIVAATACAVRFVAPFVLVLLGKARAPNNHLLVGEALQRAAEGTGSFTKAVLESALTGVGGTEEIHASAGGACFLEGFDVLRDAAKGPGVGEGRAGSEQEEEVGELASSGEHGGFGLCYLFGLEVLRRQMMPLWLFFLWRGGSQRQACFLLPTRNLPGHPGTLHDCCF